MSNLFKNKQVLYTTWWTEKKERILCPKCFRPRATLQKNGTWFCTKCGNEFLAVVKEEE